ncbi:ABC transporter ATP-binding protein [Pelagibacterium halotolerans]|uniref:Branched-chain amino acid transport ATP-binding protein LivG n=1 Tax=Pelagibacterium halotolerans (strain DSM 22347 / JCM 15775 / CGMCC 1.7692 / B2) TaxID=1082931 RepID=G4R6G2_PELHB|nr:ABC transporter ATP-binding protein [Pelagibacterium halotolerans]AEQ50167.1 branched-chain amino acid transport ATP-binding protein LivG [Pelagibacterium halotolerans B2]QJR19825.1 ABC transporter ATP-binding protein [Pelagibacterium halotolerans]SEA49548.1 amino acid/amide ABC transporter ATP-binding protein 1, HAAT family [Pelagibacterium halotolerans]
MSEFILATRALKKAFGAHKVLDGVDISVPRGEVVGLLGPNGSGKSTMLNAISGFLKPDAGEVLLSGQPVTGLESHAIARKGLIRTFQLPSMPHRMTVRDVLTAGSRTGANLGSIFKRAQQESEIEDLLVTFKLDHVANQPASSLSGGQKKLLSIATALRAQPQVLCLDEPTAGVHPKLRNDIVDILTSINARGVTMVIVEHDMGFVRNLCKRCLVLDRGSIIADCPPEKLSEDSRVVEAYLGKAIERGGVRP